MEYSLTFTTKLKPNVGIDIPYMEHLENDIQEDVIDY